MSELSRMTALNHDDSIEIISCQTSSLHDPSFANLQAISPSSGEASVSTKMLPVLKPEDEKQTAKQKRIARAVMIVAGVLILASFVLVGVTLSMAEHIDEMVRQKNGFYTTLKPPAAKPNPINYNNTAG